MIVWTSFCTEYTTISRTYWILPPVSITLFIACLLYGIMLCDSWIKSSIAALACCLYFSIRTTLKLKLMSVTYAEIALSFIVIFCFMCWAYYMFDSRNRYDFLTINYEEQITSFTSFFMEQLPIGILVKQDGVFTFPNHEFGSIFKIVDTFPMYNPTGPKCIKIMDILQNIITAENADKSLLSEIAQMKENTERACFYKFNEQDIRMIIKKANYCKKNVEILCFTDITQLRKLERDKIAKMYQTTLMATMSHELRTPLNGVICTAKLLKEKTPKELYTDVSVIESCGTQLLMKVNDMLVRLLYRTLRKMKCLL